MVTSTSIAAAVVLASARFLERHLARGKRPVARIEGWGHRTARMGMKDKLEASRGEPYLFPVMRKTIEDTYRRAGVSAPSELDGFEIHDCFTTTAYAAIDHLGITPPGKSFEAKVVLTIDGLDVDHVVTGTIRSSEA